MSDTEKPLAIATTVHVPVSVIHNAIVGAFEGGSTYWLHKADLVEGERHKTPNLVWWGEQSVFEQDGYAFQVHFDDPNDEVEAQKIIRQADIAEGLSIMATKFGRHFADLISENDDAETLTCSCSAWSSATSFTAEVV